MKINKILAAGIAATLAVTSLSAVASAEVKTLTWKMDYTFSEVAWNNQKLFYLDQNDYIKANGGSHTLAETIAKSHSAAELAKADSIFVDGAAAITKTAANGNAANLLTDALAGTDGTDFVKTGGNTWPASIKINVKTEVTTASDALTANGAIVIGTSDQSQDAIGTLRIAVNSLNAAKKKIQAARDAAAALVVGTTVAGGGAYDWTAANKEDYEEACKTLIANIDAKVAVLNGDIAAAELALLGDPLLGEKEYGGILLDTNEVARKVAAKNNIDNTDGKKVQITGAKLVIKGTKRGTTTNETFEENFRQGYDQYLRNAAGETIHIGDDTKKGKFLWIGFSPKYVNRDGFVNLNVLGTITDMQIQISYKLTNDGKGNNKWYTEKEYDAQKKTLIEDLRATAQNGIKFFDTQLTDAEFAAFDPLSGKFGAYAALTDKTSNLYKSYTGLFKSVVAGEITENSNSKKTLKPFLKMTTGQTEADIGKTITRDLVKVLSYTGDHTSKTLDSVLDGSTQTYDDDGMGTQPKWFAGLASQTADFFNKQNNGQIIFKFMDPANPALWVSYGVPSTEVGLRTLQGTAMALFFNYDTSTGSIQSIGVVDKDAWTITFDIANVLDDFGNHTKGTLEDIYYGLNTGLHYGTDYNGWGYVVENVTLQYDDAPAAVDASTDDDAAVVVADDDDDDVVADDDDDIFEDDDVVADDDDDDDDAGIIEDDDDDDTDVNNDVDYVDGADDDANPGTGVGLAVIPAIVAAAAAVVSKKRK